MAAAAIRQPKIGGVSATVVSSTSAPRQAGILPLSGGAQTILTVGGVASPPATLWLK